MAFSGILEGHVMLPAGGLLLRPTLRAVLTLEQCEGGLLQVARKISSYDLEMLFRVVVQAAGVMPRDELPTRSVLWEAGCDALGPPVLHYLAILSNGGRELQEEEDEGESTSGRLTLLQYVDWLFGIGTGWLHWTAQQTLDTPMQQIVLARKGHADMLRAIFGSPKDEVRTVSAKDPLAVRDLMRGFGQR